MNTKTDAKSPERETCVGKRQNLLFMAWTASTTSATPPMSASVGWWLKIFKKTQVHDLRSLETKTFHSPIKAIENHQ